MEQGVTPDVAQWLHGLVARQVVEVGAPGARAQAEMAWLALEQLEKIIEQGDINGPH